MKACGNLSSSELPALQKLGKYLDLREHTRFGAESVYAAITRIPPHSGKQEPTEPVVLIDISSAGVSFVASSPLDIDEIINIVLVSKSVITGHLEMAIRRAQTIHSSLHRYGAELTPCRNEQQILKHSYFREIVEQCQNNGRSIAPWM